MRACSPWAVDFDDQLVVLLKGRFYALRRTGKLTQRSKFAHFSAQFVSRIAVFWPAAKANRRLKLNRQSTKPPIQRTELGACDLENGASAAWALALF